jgi:hypothetical protein
MGCQPTPELMPCLMAGRRTNGSARRPPPYFFSLLIIGEEYLHSKNLQRYYVCEYYPLHIYIMVYFIKKLEC